MAASFTQQEVEEILGAPIGRVLTGRVDRDVLDDWLNANQQLDAAKNAIVPGFTIESLGLDAGVQGLFTTDLKTDFRDNVNASLSNFGIGQEGSFYQDPGPFLRGETNTVPRGFTTKERFPTADTAGEFTEGAIELGNLQQQGLARETLVPLADPRFKLDIPNQSNLVLYGILAFATAGIAYGVATTAAATSAAAGANAATAAASVPATTTTAAGTTAVGAAPVAGATTGAVGAAPAVGGLATGGTAVGAAPAVGGGAATIGTGAAPAVGGAATIGTAAAPAATRGALATLGTELASGAVRAGVGLAANELLGGGGGGATGDAAQDAITRALAAAEQERPLRNISAPGFTSVQEGDELSLIRSPRLEQLLTGIQETGFGAAGELEALQGRLEPGFGQLTTTTRDVFGEARRRLEGQQTQTIGDLRSNLARRRVLGSSFADDAVARRDLDFENEFRRLDVAENQALAQNFLQEIEGTVNLVNQRFEILTGTLGTEIAQANFETETATRIASGTSASLAQLAALLTDLAVQNASGSGEFLGTFLGPIVSGVGESLGEAAGEAIGGLFG